MQRLILSLFLLLSGICTSAQATDTLRLRLDSFMHLNHLKNFEKVLDFTYPKLFGLVPREQLLQVMTETFDNASMTVEMDSLETGKIYPLIKTDSGSFVKINYTMLLRMQFRDMKEDSTGEKLPSIAAILEGKYGDGNVRIDDSGKGLVIRTGTALIAIRDSYSPQWTFINYVKDDPMAEMLLNKEVLAQLEQQQ